MEETKFLELNEFSDFLRDIKFTNEMLIDAGYFEPFLGETECPICKIGKCRLIKDENFVVKYRCSGERCKYTKNIYLNTIFEKFNEIPKILFVLSAFCLGLSMTETNKNYKISKKYLSTYYAYTKERILKFIQDKNFNIDMVSPKITRLEISETNDNMEESKIDDLNKNKYLIITKMLYLREGNLRSRIINLLKIMKKYNIEKD